jgi:hypothetical protein
VEGVENDSHVYFTAYFQNDDFESPRRINIDLLETAIRAIERFSPNLQHIVLQTGGKGYRLAFPDKISIKPPLREDMPRIPKPWYDHIFYYAQYDTLRELSKGERWTFIEVRPDGIIGFVPGTNAMNLAQGLRCIYVFGRRSMGRDPRCNLRARRKFERAHIPIPVRISLPKWRFSCR